MSLDVALYMSNPEKVQRRPSSIKAVPWRVTTPDVDGGGGGCMRQAASTSTSTRPAHQLDRVGLDMVGAAWRGSELPWMVIVTTLAGATGCVNPCPASW